MRQLVGKYSKLDVVTNPPLQRSGLKRPNVEFFLHTLGFCLVFANGWCETIKNLLNKIFDSSLGTHSKVESTFIQRPFLTSTGDMAY